MSHLPTKSDLDAEKNVSTFPIVDINIPPELLDTLRTLEPMTEAELALDAEEEYQEYLRMCDEDVGDEQPEETDEETIAAAQRIFEQFMRFMDVMPKEELDNIRKATQLPSSGDDKQNGEKSGKGKNENLVEFVENLTLDEKEKSVPAVDRDEMKGDVSIPSTTDKRDGQSVVPKL